MSHAVDGTYIKAQHAARRRNAGVHRAAMPLVVLMDRAHHAGMPLFVTIAVIGLARIAVPRWFAICTWLGHGFSVTTIFRQSFQGWSMPEIQLCIDPKQVRHFPKAVKESAFVDVQLPGCGQGVPVLGKVYAQGPGVFRVGGPVIFHDTGNGRMDGSA